MNHGRSGRTGEEPAITKAFRYGLYGVGRIGRVHGQVVKDQGQIISSVGDEIPAAAVEAQRVLDVPTASVFDRPAEMIAATELDAVIISSHTKDHAGGAQPFVEAGIPVCLEKPLTAELPEAFDFVEGVGTDRTLMQIGLQHRFDEALLHAKQMLDDGMIGSVREMLSSGSMATTRPCRLGTSCPENSVHPADATKGLSIPLVWPSHSRCCVTSAGSTSASPENPTKGLKEAMHERAQNSTDSHAHCLGYDLGDRVGTPGWLFGSGKRRDRQPTPVHR